MVLHPAFTCAVVPGSTLIPSLFGLLDFEDSSSPTWYNMLDGQVNLRDAIRRQIGFKDPKTGKEYKLIDNPAVLLVR